MRSFSLPLIALLAAFGVIEVSAQQSGKNTQMRDVARHDELSQKLRMAQQADPVRDLGPPSGTSEEDPSLANNERDLVKSSTVFAYRGYLTLVPKRAVLHVPERLQDRLEPDKGAKILTWKNFHQANRGWIRTLEVTREQALGHTPFNEEITKSISESAQVVVATYKGGPISVLPLKEEEEVPTALDMKPVTFR